MRYRIKDICVKEDFIDIIKNLELANMFLPLEIWRMFQKVLKLELSEMINTHPRYSM